MAALAAPEAPQVAPARAARPSSAPACAAQAAESLSPGSRRFESVSSIDRPLVGSAKTNNICEHAYGGGAGRVWLKARTEGDALCVTVSDRGLPMPGGDMPDGALPDMDVPCEFQPEGGFGWYLIHSQVDSLDYCRRDGENILGLRFAPRSGA